MKGQTKAMSAVETLTNTAVGFGLAICCQIWIVGYYGIKTTLEQDILMTTFFTGVSILRGYAVRRFFNWLHTRNA